MFTPITFQNKLHSYDSSRQLDLNKSLTDYKWETSSCLEEKSFGYYNYNYFMWKTASGNALSAVSTASLKLMIMETRVNVYQSTRWYATSVKAWMQIKLRSMNEMLFLAKQECVSGAKADTDVEKY